MYIFLVPLMLLAFTIWKLIKLIQHRNLARRINLPYILSPVGEHDFSWILLQKPLIPLLQILPFQLGSFVRVTRRGWNYDDKCKIHQELGKAFIVVAPSGLAIYVADAASTDSILTRRKDFLKPLELAKLIDVFGQSVISSEGSDWQRHRRITAPPFNERNNGLVWNEALQQSRQMLAHWSEFSEEVAGVTTVALDTSKLALNVLMGAGFGTSYTFRDTVDTRLEGFSMTYRDALETCMSDVFMVFVMPSMIFSLPYLPRKLANYKTSVAEFKRHLRQMVAAAKAQIIAGTKFNGDDPNKATLMSALIAKAQMPQTKELLTAADSLDDSEIYGNLFMFSFAGHETMAMTLAYAMYLFAVHPEWQVWVGQEIDSVLQGHQDIETLSYPQLYPKLKRCNAVMNEVLRLYPPALSIPKTTGDSPAQIQLDGQNFTIPPHTHIYPNVIALHTNAEYWGPDSLTWRPNRWIESNIKSQSHETTLAGILESEKLINIPTKGMFVPWAEGPRVCPGKKFSQVEFVASVAVLLWKHRISIRQQGQETLPQARERARKMIKDSGILFTLRMWKPEIVGLTFIPKSSWVM